MSVFILCYFNETRFCYSSLLDQIYDSHIETLLYIHPHSVIKEVVSPISTSRNLFVNANVKRTKFPKKSMNCKKGKKGRKEKTSCNHQHLTV